MNFITYEKAYCLYPKETINKSISLVLKEYTTELYMAIKKYNLRGVTPLHGNGLVTWKTSQVGLTQTWQVCYPQQRLCQENQ